MSTGNVWHIEALAYLTRIRLSSDGTEAGTVIDTDLATAMRLRKAMERLKHDKNLETLGIETFSPRWFMAAIESMDDRRTHFTLTPEFNEKESVH